MIHVLDNVAESLMVLAKKHNVGSLKYKTADIEVELVMNRDVIFNPMGESPFSSDGNKGPMSISERELYEKERQLYEAYLLGETP
jgi:hypothetical protein